MALAHPASGGYGEGGGTAAACCFQQKMRNRGAAFVTVVKQTLVQRPEASLAACPWNRNQRAAGPEAEEPAGSSWQEGARRKVGVSERPRAPTPRLGTLAAGSLPGTDP